MKHSLHTLSHVGRRSAWRTISLRPSSFFYGKAAFGRLLRFSRWLAKGTRIGCNTWKPSSQSWAATPSETTACVGKKANARRGHQVSCEACRASRKQERQRQYREVQRLYKKNRARCADLMLSGDWSKAPKEVGIEEQEAFWGCLSTHH
jgi:hypothetical protein